METSPSRAVMPERSALCLSSPSHSGPCPPRPGEKDPWFGFRVQGSSQEFTTNSPRSSLCHCIDPAVAGVVAFAGSFVASRRHIPRAEGDV